MRCLHCGGSQSEGIVRVRRSVAVGLYVVGLVLAYALTGRLLHDLVEGGQRSLLPLWKAWLPLGVLLSAVIAGFLRWRQPVCDACGAVNPAWLLMALPKPQSQRVAAGPTRRVVLRALGGVGTGLAAAVSGAMDEHKVETGEAPDKTTKDMATKAAVVGGVAGAVTGAVVHFARKHLGSPSPQAGPLLRFIARLNLVVTGRGFSGVIRW